MLKHVNLNVKLPFKIHPLLCYLLYCLKVSNRFLNIMRYFIIIMLNSRISSLHFFMLCYYLIGYKNQ